jgi:RNA polymerase-interacting CarD/CdnL/TRCF family regulator
MAGKEKLRFEIGDLIVHYFYGVGKVVDIVEKGLDGNEKTFFKVSTKDIDYWIPVDEADVDHIEPIRSPKEFMDALNIISQPPVPIAKHHKTRKKRINDRWKNGTLKARAELLRDLHGRLKLIKLSFSEKEMLEKVRRFYINEWTITDKSMTPKKAKKLLRQALKESVRKAKKKKKSE